MRSLLQFFMIIMSLALINCSDINKDLIEAVKNNNEEDVKELIKNGANFNLKTQDKNSAYYYALSQGSTNIVKIMIENGAKVDDVVIYGQYPIHIAMRGFNNELVEYLIKAGADPDRTEANEKGETPLMVAVSNDFTGVINILLNEGVDIDKKDKGGNTALMHAAKRGNVDVVKILLKEGANPYLTNYDKPPEKKNDLFFFLDKPKFKGNTAAGIARDYGNEEVVQLIVQTAKMNEAIMKAAKKGRLNTIRALIKAGGNINGVNYEGQTVLSAAAEYEYFEILEGLLRLGANPNLKNGMAILTAAKRARYDFVKTLLPYTNTDLLNEVFLASAKALNRHFTRGDIRRTWDAFESYPTPDYNASIKEAKEVIKIFELLLNKGANVNYNKNGHTALSICAGNYTFSLEIAEFYGKSKSYNMPAILAKYLIGKGADINWKNAVYQTPLMIAVLANNVEVVQLLINNGANVNIQDKYRKTVLMYTKTYYDKITKILLSTINIDVNIKDNNGKTALIKAVTGYYLDYDFNLVKALVDKGADSNIKDKSGSSALMYAIENGYKDAETYMVKNQKN